MPKSKNSVHFRWLALPILALLLVTTLAAYILVPANLKPINNSNDCISAGYPNKPLPTGEWQCTTPDGRVFTD